MSEREQRNPASAAARAEAVVDGPAAPSGMPAALLQRKMALRLQRRRAEGGAAAVEGDAHEIAAQGTASGGQALPHLDRIQAAFGAHDVSHVQAHVGGQAAEAADALGAEAYATGQNVAFRGAPDLHTAAHEAAHVVQQRQGVQLKGGVGEEGDTYERQADAVADAVVQGRSAEGLLGPAAGHEGGGAAIQRKPTLPKGEEGFAKMWDAHPHNYQEDEQENTSSEDVLNEHGLPAWIGNTCAVRLSVMLNSMGYDITPEKVKAAGIKRAPTYSKKTKKYYLLAASEMWTYLTATFRAPDQVFPERGIYKDAAEFQKAFDETIKPIVSQRKGIVAFETIFGYSGTGHVDIFDGETLSDAPNWYPCKRLRLWNVVVP